MLPNERYPIGSQITWNGKTLTMTAEGWRAEVKPSMGRRCKKWDYRGPCSYLVTISTQRHALPPCPAGCRPPEWLQRVYASPARHPHLFGELSPEGPHIVLNALGQAVDGLIAALPDAFPELRIAAQVVMPNHVHFVVVVMDQMEQTLAQVIARWKSWVNRRYKTLALGIDERTSLGVEAPVFETGFTDGLLLDERRRQAAAAYVLDNPRRLYALTHNRACFTVVDTLRLPLQRPAEGGTREAARWWSYLPGLRHDPDELLAPMTDGVTFRAMGNTDLLRCPAKRQVQLSRSLPPDDIRAAVTEALIDGLGGTVMVSPCISEGEQRVARAVMEAGLPLIAILPTPMPDKPWGDYFDACARGQLLLLSPWRTRFALRRWASLLMNDMAAAIVAAQL